MQEAEQLARLEQQLAERGVGSETATPIASPGGSSGLTLFEGAGHSRSGGSGGGQSSNDGSGLAMVLESGGLTSSLGVGEIDIEGWGTDAGDVDLLLQDLQHSSSSSESESESEAEL